MHGETRWRDRSRGQTRRGPPLRDRQTAPKAQPAAKSRARLVFWRLAGSGASGSSVQCGAAPGGTSPSTRCPHNGNGAPRAVGPPRRRCARLPGWVRGRPRNTSRESRNRPRKKHRSMNLRRKNSSAPQSDVTSSDSGTRFRPIRKAISEPLKAVDGRQSSRSGSGCTGHAP